MTPVTVGVIAIGFLFVLLFCGMPIGIVMGMVGFFGFAFLKGFGPALGLLKTVPYSTFANYDMTVIPLFVFMGELAFAAGLSQDLYHAIYSWLGRIRGGLAIATVGGCAGFAAICGSSVATAITMGTVALPEMKKCRYDPTLSSGCVAAGGTIGILIPPSIGFIIYGIITQQSIGKLFMAGFIPGIIETIIFMIIIYILCAQNPLLGPPGKETSFREKLLAIKDAWIVLALFVIVIGGIYIGVFTPTEAAGIGATGVFIFAIIRKRLTWQAFKSSLARTRTSSSASASSSSGTSSSASSGTSPSTNSKASSS